MRNILTSFVSKAKSRRSCSPNSASSAYNISRPIAVSDSPQRVNFNGYCPRPPIRTYQAQISNYHRILLQSSEQPLPPSQTTKYDLSQAQIPRQEFPFPKSHEHISSDTYFQDFSAVNHTSETDFKEYLTTWYDVQKTKLEIEMVQRKELIRIADLDVGSQEKSSYQAESEYKESVRRYGYSDRRTRIKRSEWENAEIERREAYNKRYMNEHGADWIERKMSKLELDKSHLSVGLTTRTENWFEKLSAYDPSFREYLESIDKMTQLLGIRNLIENDTQEIPAVNEAENRGPDIPIQDSAQVSRWSDFSSNSYTVPDFDCNVDQDYQTTEVQNRFSAGDLATGQEVNGLLFPSTDDQSSPTLDRDSSYHSSQSDRRSISGVRHLHENRSSSTDDSIRFMAAHPTATNVNTNAESEDPMNIQESIKSKLSRALNKIPKKLNTSLVIG